MTFSYIAFHVTCNFKVSCLEREIHDDIGATITNRYSVYVRD